MAEIVCDVYDNNVSCNQRINFTNDNQKEATVNCEQSDKPTSNPHVLLETFFTNCKKWMTKKETDKICRKIYNAFDVANSSYKNSENFVNLINILTGRLREDPSNVFVHMLELRDELKAHKHGGDPLLGESAAVTSDEQVASTSVLNDSSTKDVSRKERQILKIEKFLQVLEKKIEKVKSKEMSLDDLDNEHSSYILLDQLVKKFDKTWKFYCKLTDRNSKTGRPVQRKFRYNGSRYPEINNHIETYMNKKRNRCPDFCDILKVVNDINTDRELNMMPHQLHDVAKDVFEDVVKMLKIRREQDFYQNSLFLVDANSIDPATTDAELKHKLDIQREKGTEKLNQVFRMYTEMQVNKDLEPEEVEINSASEDEKTDDDDDDEEKETTIKTEASVTASSDDDNIETSVKIEPSMNGDTEIKSDGDAEDESDLRHVTHVKVDNHGIKIEDQPNSEELMDCDVVLEEVDDAACVTGDSQNGDAVPERTDATCIVENESAYRPSDLQNSSPSSVPDELKSICDEDRSNESSSVEFVNLDGELDLGTSDNKVRKDGESTADCNEMPMLKITNVFSLAKTDVAKLPLPVGLGLRYELLSDNELIKKRIMNISNSLCKRQKLANLSARRMNSANRLSPVTPSNGPSSPAKNNSNFRRSNVNGSPAKDLTIVPVAEGRVFTPSSFGKPEVITLD